MKAIKNRLNKLNKLAVIDEVDTVFLTQIDIGHFEVRYRDSRKNKDIIQVYQTKEEAEKAISEIRNTKGLLIFWDNFAVLEDD
jgi:hypothetical protein